jgi:hypothetical protein
VAQSTGWSIDTDHSEIRFTVRHLHIAHVSGRAKHWRGILTISENEPLLPFPGEDGMPPRVFRWRPRAIVLLAVLTVLLAGLLVALAQYHKGQAIRSLPAESRAQLFSHSLTELRSICLQGYATRGPARAHCLEQAHFVLHFPECGSDCRTAAKAVLPHAYRWRERGSPRACDRRCGLSV